MSCILNAIVFQPAAQIVISLQHEQLLPCYQLDNHSQILSSYIRVGRFTFPYKGTETIIGDGFQMLAQTGGTIDQPVAIGRCPDNNSEYRIYPQDAPNRYYNYLVIEQNKTFTLFGFTSCRRFAGYFEIHDQAVHAFIDGESCQCQVDESDLLALENIITIVGTSLDEVYQLFAQAINVNHPKRNQQLASPIGWCSWYAYYAGVSAQDIDSNVSRMDGDNSAIEWVLLDDGYQAYMGDWLTPSDRFTNGIKTVIANIKQQGKKPAIWLAPFIAEPSSTIFKQHPEWFVRHHNGELLKAETVTYGGWRCTPWYILDTSHPQVQAHLTHVVKTMREEWGVELFKLDANYWGTLKGQRYQRDCTGVTAYRLGMEAIAKGAGTAWLLGCNAPMWPSLGLVDAMRVSDDVERNDHRFSQIAQETFYRSWQHLSLWHIDPDCATLVDLVNQKTDHHSYLFHRDALLAAGGLLLSGDPLAQWNSFAQQSFLRLVHRQQLTQQAAVFKDLRLTTAELALPLTDGSVQQLYFAFNYIDDAEQEILLEAEYATDWFDFWSGACVAKNTSTYTIAMGSGLESHVFYTVKA
ncbi:glycosyl hydrolase [Photobacterium carnosum]|uniref:glycoside hydrolase family 36 protein n=1 Tax=Photobacterium carnosum TaxID=2023717 RepID=UPI001E600E06|nr:alpha-galactosidase [Photobacterium carnosum]MCD9543390.1 glycosyl hydrolase [Photobacterium carnosum]